MSRPFASNGQAVIAWTTADPSAALAAPLVGIGETAAILNNTSGPVAFVFGGADIDATPASPFVVLAGTRAMVFIGALVTHVAAVPLAPVTRDGALYVLRGLGDTY